MIKLFKRIIRFIIFPSDPLTALRGLFVAFSLLVLLKRSYSHDFSDTLNIFVETYDSLLTKIVSPIQPIINDIIKRISLLIDVNIILHDYWKHVFVLLSIYFFSRAAGAYALGRYGTAVFRLNWGVFVALLFSLGSSLEPEHSMSAYQELRIAFSALFSIFLYELGINIWFATFFREHQANLHNRSVRGWFSEFLILSKEDGIRFFVGSALIVAMLSAPWPAEFTRPELVVIALIALLHGLFWVYWGWRQTRFKPDFSQRVASAKTNGDIMVGMAMIRSFVYAFIAVVLDAAASLV